MDKDLITNSHLLPLSLDNDDINEEFDSHISSIDSDTEVNDKEPINDDFIRLNLSNNEHSSKDEPENLSDSNNNIGLAGKHRKGKRRKRKI